ncbi:hypothetical protein Pyn_35049 [Prunus yedoensis var. nudiflora]|uniref:Desiccation-related protein PCC13-62 n=1 Tax=Prunus yedoensis var. nudiflora TaxID=2094558 RepID=A0A314Z2P0_PRUYE|nr:hypothetical protein Pyn_35049 [Prunus yedoensis var. nudiflora]
MATSIISHLDLASRPALVFVVALLEYYLISLNHLVFSANSAPNYNYCGPIEANDTDLIQFALNLEFLEAEWAPLPIGAHKANLNPLVAPIIQEFGYQEVGHLRAIITNIGGFPRPLLNLSRENFAALFDQAAGFPLTPPFDPYANSVNYLLASYTLPYMGLVAYVGTIPNVTEPTNSRLVASLLGVEAGQDAVIRALLYNMAHWKVFPYTLTVADFTNLISGLRNKLGGCGIKDEGIIVPEKLGAENRTCSNVLSADPDSLSYARTQPEILRIVYATGDESVPGGFYPRGANGNIARRFLNHY